MRLGSIAIFLILLAAPILGAQEAQATIRLPAPRRIESGSLEQALARRQAVRDFKKEALELEEVSQLLWSVGAGRPDAMSGATLSYPSAGGIYPLRILLVAGQVKGLRPGLYRYLEKSHSLSLVASGDLREAVARAALSQLWIARAAAIVVFAASVRDTERKYGERGVARYVPMDAGHAAQNLQLQVAALGLGAAPVGAFNDAALKGLLGLADEEPLLILPVGKPSHE